MDAWEFERVYDMHTDAYKLAKTAKRWYTVRALQLECNSPIAGRM